MSRTGFESTALNYRRLKFLLWAGLLDWYNIQQIASQDGQEEDF